MNAPAIMRVKSTHEPSQGPFVIINARDFDPAVHTPYDEAPPGAQSQAEAEQAPKRRGRPPRTPTPE